MFNSLQNGIVIIKSGQLDFMNELSKKVLTELSGLSNFFKNTYKTEDEEKCNPIDRKMFFIFENVGEV